MNKLRYLLILTVAAVALSFASAVPACAVNEEDGNETIVTQSSAVPEPSSKAEEPEPVSSSTEQPSSTPEETSHPPRSSHAQSSYEYSSYEEVTSYVQSSADDDDDNQDEPVDYGDENANKEQYATDYSLTSYAAPAADLNASKSGSDSSDPDAGKVKKSSGSLPIDYGKFAKKFLWLPIAGIIVAIVVLIIVNKKYGKPVLPKGRKKPDARRAYSDSDGDFDDPGDDPYNLDRFDDGKDSDDDTQTGYNDDFYDMITGEYDHYYSKPSDEDDLANYDENFRRIDRKTPRR